MNNNYRLQLRHGDEAKNFVTRYDVFKHINGQLQYGGVSLLPYEPVLFYYGEEDNKNAIIMVGLPEGDTHKGKSYFIIDTADLKEQIKAIDEKYDAAIKALQEEDGKLWEAINKEIEDRIAAVEAEAQARSEKDADLEKSIAEETEARIAAVEAEAQARSEKDAELEEAIADEAEARTKADEALQAAIDYTKADLMSVVEACGLIYNDKLAEDRVSYEPDTHDEIIRDSKDIADAVDKISKFAAKMAKDLKISVANTDTVNLTMTPNEKDGGNTITADVNIAGAEGLSKKTFDNNIIGKTTDGIYASVAIEPSEKNPNKLIVKTSGYVDGKFKVDAFETEVDLTAYIGDNGKDTGITVSVDPDKNTIKAQLNLSSDKNNILKLEDGEYVVEGVAKNIKYGDSNVAAALKGHASKIEAIEEEIEFVKGIEVKGSESSTSTVTVDKSVKGDFFVNNDVKLSKDHSIIIANGGLQANVSANFNEATSNLTITVGDNNYTANLSGLAVSVLESATYDSVTEEIVLTFRVGDSFKTLRVPVGTLIHDIEVEDTDSIDLTLKSVSGGPERLSAELKVDKAHADNLLTVNSNGAYVSRAFITEAVKEESDARKEADKELKSKIDDVTKLANDNKEAIAEEIHTARAAEKANADAIAQEIKDARAAEKANADAIDNNSKAIAENTKAIADETSRATKAEEANADAIVAEENRAKAAEAKNENAIASEIDRATEKEADLLDKIGNNDVKIKENKDAIAAEVERATKAEKVLTDSVSKNTSDIANETLRATAAEETNKTAIETEASRAKTAEGELAADVAKNATAANEAKTLAEKNKTDLATEITRATAAEKAIADAIASEASRATTAEETINAKVTKNTTDIESAKNNITAESTRATAAEAELTTKLTDEVTRAKAAENANATAIGNETARATEKENEIDGKVNNNTANIAQNTAAIQSLNVEMTSEVARAKAAEEANKTAIETEKGRAEHAEADLLEKINANADAIKTITTEVGNIELVKEGDLSYALYVNGTKHGEFTIPKDQFLKSVNYNASTKELVFVFNTSAGETTTTVSIADLIDTYVAGEGLLLNGNVFSVDFTSVASVEAMQAAVNAEAARAKAAEGVITNELANEITRAKAAESANATAIETEASRAKTAEGVILEKTVEESNRAKAAETALESNVAKAASDIITESTRATAAEAELTNKLSNEVIRAKAAEEANATLVEAEASRAKAAEEANKTAIETEKGRAEHAEADLLEKIGSEHNLIESVSSAVDNATKKAEDDLKSVKAELTSEINKKANSADVYTKEETLNKLGDYAKTVDVQSKLDEKANVVDVKNVYATKEALQELKDGYASTEYVDNEDNKLAERISGNETAIDNFNLTYDAATSTLVYTDKNGQTNEYKLYSGSLIKNGRFDEDSNSIILTIENAGQESQIVIPVSKLLTDLSKKIEVNSEDIKKINEALTKVAKDWTVKNSNTIDLVKSTVGEKDELTASVRVATSNKNAIQTGESGLYVSNDLEDFTCVFGTETISGQSAISTLYEGAERMSDRITTNERNIELLSSEVTKNTTDISNLKDEVNDTKTEMASIKSQVAANTTAITRIDNEIDRVESRLDNVTDRLETAEGNITSMIHRLAVMEEDVANIKKDLKAHSDKFVEVEAALANLGNGFDAILAELDKVKLVTGYPTYVNTKNMSVRLDNIDEQMKEIVDAGTF